MKYEWRKKETSLYIPKSKPELIEIPEFNFLTIDGDVNPESDAFASYIEALYSVSYAVKMTLKKENNIENYTDYTVYPLEGIWDLKEEARKTYNGTINTDDLVFKLMIRQPDYIPNEYIFEMIEYTKKKKKNHLLNELNVEKITDGKCIQMLHIGPFENEPESFELMEHFCMKQGLKRKSKVHREIYLSDFRKVQKEKLKTVLRFCVS